MKKKRAEALQNDILNILLVILPLVLGLVLIPTFLGSIREEYKNTFYGYRAYVVKSGSMDDAAKHTIRPGALVIGKAVKFDKLEKGDIISFLITHEGRETLNTHRIVEKNVAYLTTRGDNAPTADYEPVTQSNYKYRVASIWNWTAQLKTPKGIVIFVLLPLFGLMILVGGGFALIWGLRARAKKKAAPVWLPPAPEPEPVPEPEPEPSAPEPVPEPEPEPEPDEEDALLSRIDAALQPKAKPVEINEDETDDEDEWDDDEELDLLLQVTAALHSASLPKTLDDDEEDCEWFDQYLGQRGILLR